jgi:hypothetical protein
MQTVDFVALAEAVSQVGLTPQLLREVRLRTDNSYREWGEVVGVSGSYLCNLEMRKRRVTPEFARRFLAVMEALSMVGVESNP